MVGGEAMLCNLWPYWFAGTAAFGAGANCRGDQYLFPPSLIPPTDGCLPGRHELQRQWYVGHQGWFHNF